MTIVSALVLLTLVLGAIVVVLVVLRAVRAAGGREVSVSVRL